MRVGRDEVTPEAGQSQPPQLCHLVLRGTRVVEEYHSTVLCAGNDTQSENDSAHIIM